MGGNFTNYNGFNRSLERVISMTQEHFARIGEPYDSYDFCVANGTTQTEIEKLKNSLENLIGRPVGYPVFKIGVTIGTNTGPFALGVCFIKKYDVLS